MKRVIRAKIEPVLGMANLNPKRTNLPVIIWADHNGVNRTVSHRKSPRIKLSKGEFNMSISIEENPKILAQSPNITKSDMKDFERGIEYVARNFDIFLKHYLDTDFSFDDDDLKDELRVRGDYR